MKETLLPDMLSVDVFLSEALASYHHLVTVKQEETTMLGLRRQNDLQFWVRCAFIEERNVTGLQHLAWVWIDR